MADKRGDFEVPRWFLSIVNLMKIAVDCEHIVVQRSSNDGEEWNYIRMNSIRIRDILIMLMVI